MIACRCRSFWINRRYLACSLVISSVVHSWVRFSFMASLFEGIGMSSVWLLISETSSRGLVISAPSR